MYRRIDGGTGGASGTGRHNTQMCGPGWRGDTRQPWPQGIVGKMVYRDRKTKERTAMPVGPVLAPKASTAPGDSWWGMGGAANRLTVAQLWGNRDKIQSKKSVGWLGMHTVYMSSDGVAIAPMIPQPSMKRRKKRPRRGIRPSQA